MYSQQKCLNFGQYVPNDKVLNKKIPENPRYKHVKPAVNTGKNVKRHIDDLKEKQKSCNQKKDEVFNRIKFSTFIKLAISVAVENLKTDLASDHDGKDENENNDTIENGRSKMANVLVGIGEIDLRNEKKKTISAVQKAEKKDPYLLLDVRDSDQFQQCHIKTAKHYPSAMLSRSIGYELDDMKLYKNIRPELIILYDDDESIASRVATTLVQRGYENVYLLSGGLKLGYEVFPRALMTAICTGHYSAVKLGPSSIVQIKAPTTEYFSQDDIDNIQQYISDCPRKGTPMSVGCKKNYLSCSKSSNSGSCAPKTTDESRQSFPSKLGSVTYRLDSANSVKSADQTQTSQSVTNRKTRTARRAPWK